MNDISRVLVTGGCGFIGCNFIKMIVNEYPTITVINLDALTYAGNLENLKEVMDSPRYHFIKGDICDENLVRQIITEHQIEGIINFAAESHVDRSITGPKIFIDTNVSGTLTLLQQALTHGIKRFLQVSTDEVYGSLGPQGAFTEKTSVKPNSPYSASKASADHFVHAFHHTHNLNTVITRCSNNYGSYQFPEKLIPLIFYNAKQDKKLPVYGDGLQVRDWLYVYDHCTAIWAAFTQGESGEVYNIGGCNEKTNLEVIRAILDYLDKPDSLIEFVTDRPGHDRRYAIDSTKVINELSWRPSVTFEEGMSGTLDWYMNNSDWVEHVTSGTYQRYYEEMYKNR